MKNAVRMLLVFSALTLVVNSVVVALAGAQEANTLGSLKSPAQLNSFAKKLFVPLLHPDLPDARFASDVRGLPGFPDVDKHSAQCFALRTLNKQGVISGHGDGYFRPHNPVTRGQFAKIISLAYAYTPDPVNYPAPNPVRPAPGTATFADVPTSNPFFVWIESATWYGFMSGRSGISGVPDNCTGPGLYENPNLSYFKWCDNISRAQASKPIANASRFTNNVAGRSSFSDVSFINTFHAFIERLQLWGAVEEVPLDTPDRPSCGTPGSRPCFHPNMDMTRIDTVQLIWLARNRLNHPLYGFRYGQAFPRRLTEISGQGGHDGVQAFVKAPSSNPPDTFSFKGAPLGVADAVNLHFIESGPARRCFITYPYIDAPEPPPDESQVRCYSFPFASSGTGRTCYDPNTGNEIQCREEYDELETEEIPAGANHEFRSHYVGEIGYTPTWYAEWYNPRINQWRTLIIVTRLGTDRMREVFGAAETSDISIASDTVRITNARSRAPGSSQYTGWCYDAGITPLKMFNSTFGPCPPPGVEPFSWDVRYVP